MMPMSFILLFYLNNTFGRTDIFAFKYSCTTYSRRLDVNNTVIDCLVLSIYIKTKKICTQFWKDSSSICEYYNYSVICLHF